MISLKNNKTCLWRKIVIFCIAEQAVYGRRGSKKGNSQKRSHSLQQCFGLKKRSLIEEDLIHWLIQLGRKRMYFMKKGPNASIPLPKEKRAATSIVVEEIKSVCTALTHVMQTWDADKWKCTEWIDRGKADFFLGDCPYCVRYGRRLQHNFHVIFTLETKSALGK